MLNRTISISKAIVLVTSILLTVADLEAATYYVRKSGKNNNSGTAPDDAWKKIQSAADVMVAGDTVYVGTGSYNERVRPANDGTSTDPIRYVADSDGSMTGDAGDVEMRKNGQRPLEVNGDNYIHVIGFQITGSEGSVLWRSSVGGLLQDCEISSEKDGIAVETNSELTVLNCTVEENGDYGLCVMDSVSNTDLIVAGCTFTNNSKAAIGFPSDPWSNVTVMVENCLIHDNFDRGIEIGSESNGLSVTIWNTTIARNNSAGIEQKGAALTITNSIVAFNDDKGLLADGGSLTHTYNLVYGNDGGDYEGTAPDATELSADPLFENIYTFDYHLTQPSPAVDAGADAAGIVDDDLEGTSRPQGTGWDLGCYESPYTGATPGSWRIVKWVEIDKP